VTEDGDSAGDTDGLVTAPVGISHIGAEERKYIDPELIESADTSGNTLALVERARLAIGEASTGARSIGKGLLDEVGDCEVLDQL
jgi:hypothetical protein